MNDPLIPCVLKTTFASYWSLYIDTSKVITPTDQMLFQPTYWNQQSIKLLYLSWNYSTTTLHMADPQTTEKISSAVPIPKIPRAKSTSAYRPTSLLSILSKVLEHHIHCIISDHLLTHYPSLWLTANGYSRLPAQEMYSLCFPVYAIHEWFQYTWEEAK